MASVVTSIRRAALAAGPVCRGLVVRSLSVSVQRRQSQSCYSCGEVGHMSRNCPNRSAAGDPSMRDMSTVICLRCMEPGHMARTCTNPASPNSTLTCFNCGQTGHMRHQCTEPQSAHSGGGGNGPKCYSCGQVGHMAAQCPNGRQGGNTGFGGGQGGFSDRGFGGGY